MFEDEYNKILKLKHDTKGVKKFLLNDFIYYTNLYGKIYHHIRNYSESQPYVYFNSLTEMNTQFLLILSACELNDSEEEEKIRVISRSVDRMFCLLQLQRSYKSNLFSTEIYKLSARIRNKSVSEILEVFDEFILQQLGEGRGSQPESLFNYSLFK